MDYRVSKLSTCPALPRYMSSLFLNRLTLLAPTQSGGNMFLSVPT